jgi:GT2 family glycosyltransferase
LEALLRQDLAGDAYEIIVADDGPDPETRDIVEVAAILAGGRPAVRYIAVTGSQGPAAARNRGWRAAAADVVAFTDDDTIPSRSWLREGLAAMRPGIAAAAGRIRMVAQSQPTDYERDASALSRAEFATANCFVRQDDLASVGGFDERFAMAWREDSDLHFTLLRRGALIERAPLAVVTHPIRAASWGVSLRQQSKIVYDALLFKKHPDFYRARIRARPRWDYYAIVTMLIGAPLAAVEGAPIVAVTCAGLWGGMTIYLCIRRLRGTSRRLSHVAEMVATSIAIPPCATFWRLVGAFRYRAIFL